MTIVCLLTEEGQGWESFKAKKNQGTTKHLISTTTNKQPTTTKQTNNQTNNKKQRPGPNRTEKETNRQAKAQEPIKVMMKIQLGKKYNIASLNIRGTMKLGLRDEVENWMRRKQIMILGLQETRSKQNTRESRKEYTWFFSGEGGRDEWTAGVGFVINNKFLQYIQDIEPINDRLIYILH